MVYNNDYKNYKKKIYIIMNNLIGIILFFILKKFSLYY